MSYQVEATGAKSGREVVRAHHDDAGTVGAEFKRQKLESGVDVKGASFDWHVKNFSIIVQRAFLMNSQAFQCEVVDCNRSKSRWTFSLRREDENWVSLVQTLDSNFTVRHNTTVSSWVDCGNAEAQQTEKFNWVLATNYGNSNKIYKSQHGEEVVWKKIISATSPVTISTLRIHISIVIYSNKLIKRTIIPPASRVTRVNAFQQKCKDRVSSILGALEGDQESSDVNIISKDGLSFPSHRIILSKASIVFQAMFRSPMSESETGVIMCDDLSGKCVKILIHFIYTGKLAEDWADSDVIWELTYAAGKYQLKDLLEFLDESLGSFVRPEDARKLLTLAKQLSLKRAEKELFDLFKLGVASATSIEELDASF